MQFTTLFFTLMASTMVMALPTEEVGTGTASAQVECPSGWVQSAMEPLAKLQELTGNVKLEV
ncbi:hypothetical protein MW887_008390 [Aspergillus wentii]|nr:hypothetical protein MW887_008390 [Aspergillus wentii]